MDSDLTYLAWTVVLAFVQIVGTAQFFTAANGLAYGAGPRDEPPPGRMSVHGQRMEKATKNLLETFPLAAAAFLIAHVVGRHNAYTAWGPALYFWARVVYLPLYVLGVPYIRTLVWFVSVIGIVLVLVGLHWG